ncbi:hypothetical protein M758_UG297000 [Ceratodon purpureus]|nr:hypothetical protein M758_UG297000 [Ceratodon purpureus]
MEQPRRLPISDPRRVKARERKREISFAIREQLRTSQPYLKLSCPCRLCEGGFRKDKFASTVYEHLDSEKMYERDPKHYGKSKGYDTDDSDQE